jgi:hypothetical protein
MEILAVATRTKPATSIRIMNSGAVEAVEVAAPWS